jgi:hypothetical protein
LFYWFDDREKILIPIEPLTKEQIKGEGIDDDPEIDTISTFSATEIGVMLPVTLRPEGTHYHGDHVANSFYLEVEQDEKGWMYWYTNGEENLWHKYPDYDTEANARGKLLLYLQNNGYIKPEKLNTK